jgi:hypothetical protein
VGAVDPAEHQRHLFYIPRLVAFILIAIGVVDRNRATRDTPQIHPSRRQAPKTR